MQKRWQRPGCLQAGCCAGPPGDCWAACLRHQAPRPHPPCSSPPHTGGGRAAARVPGDQVQQVRRGGGPRLWLPLHAQEQEVRGAGQWSRQGHSCAVRGACVRAVQCDEAPRHASRARHNAPPACCLPGHCPRRRAQPSPAAAHQDRPRPPPPAPAGWRTTGAATLWCALRPTSRRRWSRWVATKRGCTPRSERTALVWFGWAVWAACQVDTPLLCLVQRACWRLGERRPRLPASPPLHLAKRLAGGGPARNSLPPQPAAAGCTLS